MTTSDVINNVKPYCDVLVPVFMSAAPLQASFKSEASSPGITKDVFGLQQSLNFLGGSPQFAAGGVSLHNPMRAPSDAHRPQALENARRPNYLTICSGAALIGAAYCCGVDGPNAGEVYVGASCILTGTLNLMALYLHNP